jgi:hypothetical protein
MSELTLIEALTSRQVIVEAESELSVKIPKALPAFRMLISRCLRVVEDRDRSELEAYTGSADPKDLPVLVAAVRESCAFLATFNLRHFQPGIPSVVVLRPGDLVLRVRYLLSSLKQE